MGLHLDRVRAIIYDLDGTVYDDTRHFGIYASEIESHLPEAVRPAFREDYMAVLHGRHPALRIGTFYDRERDLVLHMRGGSVLRALHWNGSEISLAQCDALYPGAVESDQRTIINVGDLWWVPAAISMHYGGVAEKHQLSFWRIRDLMAEPSFAIRSIDGLCDAVQGMKGICYQVLATNSPQPDSEAILRKIALHGLFDRLHFQVNKPSGLITLIHELEQELHISPAAILSIGDNLVNEITPARMLGCQTAFIDPHGVSDPGDADLIVPDMAALLPHLQTLAIRGRPLE